MPGVVLASHMCRLAYAAVGQAVDLNIWGAKINSADARIETQAYHILIVHCIIEAPQVMIQPKEELIRQPRSYCTVQNGGPVLDADGIGLKIRGVNRIEIGGSVARSDKTSDSQPLRRSESIVHSPNAVVADRIVV